MYWISPKEEGLLVLGKKYRGGLMVPLMEKTPLLDRAQL
jgi:hypothetical protein